jgi:hypothetical protein
LKKAQLAAYESHRAMFEAYSRNKYNSTGLVQWMLNSAWPSNMWHLFDYYLQSGGSYFGAKKANSQPLHLLYSYDLPPSSPHAPSFDTVQVLHTDTVEDQYAIVKADRTDECCHLCIADAKCTHSIFGGRGECYLKNMKQNDGGNTMTLIASQSGADTTLCLKRKTPNNLDGVKGNGGTIAVVNSLYAADGDGLTVEAVQFDLSGKALVTQTHVLHDAVAADGTLNLFRLDLNPNRTSTVLLRLRFLGRPGTEDNWYWLPVHPDTFDMRGGCFTGCPVESYADMQDLAATMPPSPKITVTLNRPLLVAGAWGEQRLRRSVLITVAPALQPVSGGSVGGGTDGGGLAFFVRLRALDAVGLDVLPATWSDNFITLLAGTEATVVLEYEAGGASVSTVTAEAFNSF